MKTKIFFLVLLIGLALGPISVPAQISATNILFNPALPVGTNTGLIYTAAGNLRLTPLTFQLQHGAEPTTNTLGWRVRLAIGNTNSWLVVTNWYHNATNPMVETLPVDLNSLPVFVTVDAIVTNSVFGSATILHQ